jgi:hypothetical protein
MLDHTAATLALRARAIATTLASTSGVDLTATTTGYTRADAGSFLTDGFRSGMEVTPAGFSANAVDVITEVTASTITTKTAHAAQSSGRSGPTRTSASLVRGNAPTSRRSSSRPPPASSPSRHRRDRWRRRASM